MSIENKKIDIPIEVPKELWTIRYRIEHQSTYAKIIYKEKPFTEQSLIALAPSIRNTFDANGYRYTFVKWLYSESVNAKVVDIQTKYNSTALYTWKQYQCVMSNLYKWNRFNLITNGKTFISSDSFSYQYVNRIVFRGYFTLISPNIYTSFSDGSTAPYPVFRFDGGSSTYRTINAYTSEGGVRDRYNYASYYTKTTGSDNYIYLDLQNNSDGQYMYMFYAYLGGSLMYINIDKYIAGEKTGSVIDVVSSSTQNTYPIKGPLNGYWYEYIGSETVYNQGSYLTNVTSTNSSEYPTNGRHTDGYWYIKQ